MTVSVLYDDHGTRDYCAEMRSVMDLARGAGGSVSDIDAAPMGVRS